MPDRNFINFLPRKACGPCAIWVEELVDRGRIDWWMDNIQPVIAQDQNRTDADWDWRAYYDYLRMAFLRREPCFFALCMDNNDEVIVLALAMCLADESYPVDKSLRSLFGWYLTAAPEVALAKYLHPDDMPKLIGRGCLDSALIKSVATGNMGRIWLHADEKGGQELFDIYINWKMINIPRGVRVQRFLKNRNDGRYFYYGAKEADTAMQVFDPFR